MQEWSPAQYSDWASDFNLVWGEVSGAKRLCDRLNEAETNGYNNNTYKGNNDQRHAQ
jgi:hypothetical protein